MRRLGKVSILIALMVVVILMSGTAHSGYGIPLAAYNPVNNTYLIVATGAGSICGRWLDNRGKQVGQDFLISTAPHAYGVDLPALAYDSVNRRFLVTWTAHQPDPVPALIYGQLVNADGTLQGANFPISTGSRDQTFSSIAFDSVNQRFLVTWRMTSTSTISIYGQLVNANGTLFGNVRPLMIAAPYPDAYYASSGVAAYDSVNQRFLVTAEYHYNGSGGSGLDVDIRGQIVEADGTPFGGNLVIGTGPSGRGGQTITYDDVLGRFLVAWGDCRTGLCQIYGQFIDGDGTFQGDNFAIKPGPSPRGGQSVVYDSIYRRFALTWMTSNLYGGFLNPDGTTHGTDLLLRTYYQIPQFIGNSSVMAYNPTCANSLVAFQISTATNGLLIDQKVIGPCRRTNLIAPQGGAVLPAGTSYDILFRGGPGTDHVNIAFTADNGATWTRIATDITGTAFTWDVPTFLTNATQCLIKVTAFDAANKVVGSEVSDGPFTITVVKLTSPNGGESLSSGTDVSITWTTNATKRQVHGVQLYYSIDAGATWRLITKDIAGNPGSYSWTVPHLAVTRRNCKVRVVLTDDKGRTIGSDMSDAAFTITP